MKKMIALARFVFVAAAILLLGGCRGCEVPVTVTTKGPKWEAVAQQFQRDLFINLLGPPAVASAVGSATPLNACSPLSALGTEAAWRTMLETELNRPYDMAIAASLVGTLTVTNWSGVSAVGTFGVHGDQGQNFGGRWRLPSLLGTQEPIPGIEAEERTFVIRVRRR